MTSLNIGGDYLVFQNDGNIVAYYTSGAVSWNSNTFNVGTSYVMGNNGVLYIYRSNGNFAWSSLNGLIG